MAQKGSRKRELTIDEEKDIFLSFINKKSRNNRKKLEQIDELVKKDKSTLKPEQLDKINSKAEVDAQVKYYDKIKDLYYEAQKTAKEEGKEETGVTIKKEESQPEPTRKVSEPVEEKVSVTDSLLKILNLVHLAQLFGDHNKREEFRSKVDKHEHEFDILYEFYAKIFTFSEADKFERVDSKINTSLKELEYYLNSDDKPALRNKSYKHLHESVERIVGTSFFKEQKADISVPKTGASTQISAIGSELRQEKSQQTPDEPRGLADLRAESNIISKKEEQKEQSPIKQPVEREKQPEAITVQQLERNQEAQRAQEKRQWADVQDEEEGQGEEEEEEEGDEGEEEEKQQGGTAPEKTGDGFIEVKPKGKDKKPEGEGAQRGKRGGRGGRRGGGRGSRGGEFRGSRGGDRGGDRPRREGGEGQTEGGEGFRGDRGGKYQFKKKYVEKEGEKKPEEQRESH